MFYRSINDELINKYGCKVYKIALDGGFSCPNRDGKIGYGGCIFCLSGSGSFAEKQCESVTKQIENAKKRLGSKIKNGKYIAYFQSYTNTYAPIEKLRKLFTEAINNTDIVALSIATRPDCLGDDVVSLLAELNHIKPVWIELGLQTIHEKTAQYIRRGYALPIFDDAVRKLKNNGIYVITHMIIGLPFETDEMMYETAEYIGRSGCDGVKFQLLHVLSGTDLAKDYEKGVFKEMSMEHYVSVLEECTERIPANMTIHRITGDGDKKFLLAPLWSSDKKKVLNYINKRFYDDDIMQGRKALM